MISCTRKLVFFCGIICSFLSAVSFAAPPSSTFSTEFRLLVSKLLIDQRAEIQFCVPSAYTGDIFSGEREVDKQYFVGEWRIQFSPETKIGTGVYEYRRPISPGVTTAFDVIEVKFRVSGTWAEIYDWKAMRREVTGVK